MVQNDRRTLLIGVAGPSGSGKSCFARALQARLGDGAVILSQDDYYRDLAHLPLADRSLLNFDHPDAVDFEQLTLDLQELKKGKAVEHPLYDFSVHTRRAERQTIGPAETVIVEGILILAVEACRRLFDLSIYIDTSPDICFIRRLRRDMQERGRTVDSVVRQYLDTVRPMYLQFVAPSRRHADLVLSGEASVENAAAAALEWLEKKRKGNRS